MNRRSFVKGLGATMLLAGCEIGSPYVMHRDAHTSDQSQESDTFEGDEIMQTGQIISSRPDEDREALYRLNLWDWESYMNHMRKRIRHVFVGGEAPKRPIEFQDTLFDFDTAVTGCCEAVDLMQHYSKLMGFPEPENHQHHVEGGYHCGAVIPGQGWLVHGDWAYCHFPFGNTEFRAVPIPDTFEPLEELAKAAEMTLTEREDYMALKLAEHIYGPMTSQGIQYNDEAIYRHRKNMRTNERPIVPVAQMGKEGRVNYYDLIQDLEMASMERMHELGAKDLLDLENRLYTMVVNNYLP